MVIALRRWYCLAVAVVRAFPDDCLVGDLEHREVRIVWGCALHCVRRRTGAFKGQGAQPMEPRAGTAQRTREDRCRPPSEDRM